MKTKRSSIDGEKFTIFEVGKIRRAMATRAWNPGEIYKQLAKAAPQLSEGKSSNSWEKVITGKNCAQDYHRGALAKAFDVPLPIFESYLRGEITELPTGRETRVVSTNHDEILVWPDVPRFETSLRCALPLQNETSSSAAPSDFYRGSAITIGGLRANLDVRRRLHSSKGSIDYSALMGQEVRSAIGSAKTQKVCSLFLFTGVAGTGKSTLLYRIAYDVSESEDIVCLFTYDGLEISGTDLIHDLEVAQKLSGKKVVAVFIDEAGRSASAINAAFAHVRRKGNMAVCFFVADQPNKVHPLPPTMLQFALGDLDDAEILDILETLQAHDSLGKLEVLTPSERIHLFKKFAKKQLLVALHEAITGEPFAQFMRAEFRNIPSETGQALYRLTALMHHFDLRLPVEGAIAILGPGNWQSAKHSCKDIVIIQLRDSLNQPLLRTRHAVIADEIFHFQFRSDSPSENGQTFAKSAEDILSGLYEQRNLVNGYFFRNLARDFLFRPLFGASLNGAYDLSGLARAVGKFDDNASRPESFLLPRVASFLRKSGHQHLSFQLLFQGLVHLSPIECKSLLTCSEVLTSLVCDDARLHQYSEKCLQIMKTIHSLTCSTLPNRRIPIAITKLLELRGTNEALDEAILFLTTLLTESPKEIIASLAIRLSHVRERRNAANDISTAEDELRKLLSIQPAIPDRVEVLIRLTQLMASRYAEKQNCDLISDLIALLTENLETATVNEYGKIATRLSVLLQERGRREDVILASDILYKTLSITPHLPDHVSILKHYSNLLERRSRDENNPRLLRRAASRIHRALRGLSPEYLDVELLHHYCELAMHARTTRRIQVATLWIEHVLAYPFGSKEHEWALIQYSALIEVGFQRGKAEFVLTLISRLLSKPDLVLNIPRLVRQYGALMWACNGRGGVSMALAEIKEVEKFVPVNNRAAFYLELSSLYEKINDRAGAISATLAAAAEPIKTKELSLRIEQRCLELDVSPADVSSLSFLISN